MYLRCHDGDQTLMKKLQKGSSLLPAPEEEGKPYVVLRPSMLPRLFAHERWLARRLQT
jgi:hypothetical protein